MKKSYNNVIKQQLQCNLQIFYEYFLSNAHKGTTLLLNMYKHLQIIALNLDRNLRLSIYLRQKEGQNTCLKQVIIYVKRNLLILNSNYRPWYSKQLNLPGCNRIVLPGKCVSLGLKLLLEARLFFSTVFCVFMSFNECPNSTAGTNLPFGQQTLFYPSRHLVQVMRKD